MRIDLTDEKFITGFLIVTSLFLWVNFDSLLGGVYTGFVLVYMISISTNFFSFVQIYDGRTSLATSLITAGIVFALYMIMAGFTITYINPNIKFSLLDTSVFTSIAQKTNIPVFKSDNPIVKQSVYGIFVPIAESLFALSFILNLFAKGLKVPIEWTVSNIKMYWVAILVGMVMAFFHATVRQLSGYALITDAIFFGISALLIFYRKQLLDAMFIHIMLNSFVLSRGV